jgi:hypothetical protein
LCIIGLVYDGCRYLQDNNEWERAAWLAKIRLNQDEYNEVIKRWCEQLCSNQINRKEFAILLLLSCKQYSKVLELLCELSYPELSFYYTKLCLEKQLINFSDSKILSDTGSNIDGFLRLLKENIDKIENQPLKKNIDSYLKLRNHLSYEF